MEINTGSIFGYLRFYVLAKLRGFRPKTFRYQEEQRAIETWLRMIAQAAPLSGDLALEIAECARLIKGYGDTHKRGTDNYRLIEQRTDGSGARRQYAAAPGRGSDRQCAHRGLLDPEGEALVEVSQRY